jgi:hypothetical protein
MPYIIKKVKNAYKVCKSDNTNVCFSNKSLSKKKAIKQRIAIIISEKGQAPYKPPMKKRVQKGFIPLKKSLKK